MGELGASAYSTNLNMLCTRKCCDLFAVNTARSVASSTEAEKVLKSHCGKAIPKLPGDENLV